MKLKLGNKIIFLHFRYSIEEKEYNNREYKFIEGNNVLVITKILAQERTVKCIIRDENLQVIAEGSSVCHYSDRFVKAVGREKAINNLRFTHLDGWRNLNHIYLNEIKKQYNNRK